MRRNSSVSSSLTFASFTENRFIEKNALMLMCRMATKRHKRSKSSFFTRNATLRESDVGLRITYSQDKGYRIVYGVELITTFPSFIWDFPPSWGFSFSFCNSSSFF